MAVAHEIVNSPTAAPDYRAIQRAIMLSEPPFAADLESQVKFCKIWGGGKTQHVTLEICNYIKLAPEYFKISATQLDASTSLKCPPHELPTRTVAAVMKTIATRGFPNNGIGTAMTSATIKQLMSNDAKTVAARQFIDRAYEVTALVVNADADTIAQIRGDYECNVIEKTFMSKPATKHVRDSTMEQLTEEFGRKLQGQDLGASTAASSSVANDEGGNVFDTTAHDAHIKALGKIGIAKGQILEYKNKDSPKNVLESQFEVMYLNEDGSFGVRRISRDSTLTDDVVPVKLESLNSYSILKQEHRITMSSINQPTLLNTDIIATIADSALYKAYNDHRVDINADVYVQTSPKIRLMARRSLDVGSLTLVPWTTAVQRKPLKDDSDTALFVNVHINGMCLKFEIKQPSGIGKTIEVEYWRVQTERDQNKFANVTKDTVTVSVPCLLQRNPVKCDVPVLLISKAIAENTEIKFFEAPKGNKRKAEFIDVSAFV
jgi:hypothetical protein